MVLVAAKALTYLYMSCLLRGEFDDQLKWQFRSEITVQLLDQAEHKNHVEEKIKYSSKTRVMMRRRARSGWGCCKFFPHSDLQPKIPQR